MRALLEAVTVSVGLANNSLGMLVTDAMLSPNGAAVAVDAEGIGVDGAVEPTDPVAIDETVGSMKLS